MAQFESRNLLTHESRCMVSLASSEEPILVAQALAANSFSEKLVLALIGAGLGFAFALILDQIKKRRESKFELSWDVDVDRSFVTAGKEIRDKVEMRYAEHRVSKLCVVRCRVENTGNQTIKDERLRFTFVGDTAILEASVDPEPEREVGLREDVESRQSSLDRIYSIAHLPPTASLTFVMVLDGDVAREWSPYHFNDEMEVAFTRRGVSRSREDQEHVQPFISTFMLLLLLPPVLDALPSIGDLAALGLRVVLVALLVPHLAPFARVVSDLIERKVASRYNIRIDGGQAVMIGEHGVQHTQFHGLQNPDTREHDASVSNSSTKPSR